MLRIIQFLKHKWLVSSIGLLALAIIIWVGGPYLGLGNSRPLEPEFNRLLTILAVVIIWGFNNLRQQNKANKSNQHMIEQLVVPATDSQEQDVSSEEVDLLRERFEGVLQQLKQTGLKGLFAKQYLYELPWYIIIGPPGAGKTTLLENSGLEFPLTANDSSKRVKGVGGTRNCDWWFTDRAVLLDTAGRYVTQDSYAEADSGAWLGFLDLLRKNRPRRPLNGILIAVSLHEILTSTATEREQHAQAIRQRINELYSRLGMRLPIYYTFTKCDLIAGFTEFFDDLDQHQRKQIWGMTFSQENNEDADPISRFGLEYDALIKRINERLLLRLQEERDLSRRTLINSFPQQLASIRSSLDDFLQKIFRSNRYEQAFWLRGIYFTSGTQNGSPIDNIMQSLASSFRLSAHAPTSFIGQARAYFIQHLFNKIIFDESDLAGANRKYERQRVWLQYGSYAAALVITLALITAWSASFTSNGLYLNKLSQRIEQFETYTKKLGTRLNAKDLNSVLDHAQNLTTVYSEETPWLTGMGLYQGIKLGRSAQRAYLRILNRYLLPHIQQTLEYSIRREQKPEALGRLLGMYLMLGDTNTLDSNRIKPWIEKDWQKQFGRDVKGQKSLSNHLHTLFEQGDLAPQKLDDNIKRRAQRVVCEIPLHNQVYDRLKQTSEDGQFASYSLRNMGRTARIFTSGSRNQSVHALYTYDGYHKIFVSLGKEIVKKTIEENRQLCQGAQNLETIDAERVLTRVEQRYFDDYVLAWKHYLNRIHLKPFEGVRDAEKILKILSGPESPLQILLKDTTNHTLLTQSTDEKVAGLIGFDRSRPDNPVEIAYQDLHKLNRPAGKEPAPIEDILAQLKELHGLVAEIAEGINPNEASFEFAQGRLSSGGKDVIRKLRNRSRSLANPAKQIVASAALQSWTTMLAGARGHINSAWRNTVLRDFEQGLKNRYPLYRRGHRQATLEDFGRFFGYDGSVDQFITIYLKPFVDTRRWRAKVIDDGGLALSANALKQLKRASMIKKVFFQQGSQQPSLRFTLRPLDLDKRAKRFSLDLNGQNVVFFHGPRRSSKMEWPGPGIGGDVRYHFERLGTGRVPRMVEGTWAWFKLLDQSRINQRRGRDRVVVTFSADGLRARYQLRASSVHNPFSSNMLSFRCPTSL